MTFTVEGTIQWHDDAGMVTHDIEYTATIDIDNNYGSDADGNRGRREVSIDLDYDYPYKKMEEVDEKEIYESVYEHAIEQSSTSY